jgi:hypothetical protein
MIFHVSPARALLIVVALLWLTPVASAQDAMTLDLAFKNSLAQGHGPEIEQTSTIHARRHEARDSRRLIANAKRRVHRRWAEQN